MECIALKSLSIIAGIIVGFGLALFSTVLAGDTFIESILFGTFGPIFGISGWFLWSFRIRVRLANNGSYLQTLNIRLRNTIRLGDVESQKEEQDTYFDRLVRINLDNLADYYVLVKEHTHKSFNTSIVTGLIGFGLIAVGLLAGFIMGSDTNYTAYISTGSGIIIEFIAGVFFYLYNKTTRQLKEYHDSLLNVQNILLSFKLVEDIDEEKTRALMIGDMLKYLLRQPTTTPSISNAPAGKQKGTPEEPTE